MTAIGHMPFPGHRNQKEVREDEERCAALKRSPYDQLPWCPLEYREEYQCIRSNKHMGASEAKRIIEDKIASDRRRAG